MTYKSHVALSTIIAMPLPFIIEATDILELVVYFSAAFVGSLAPDLDEEGSYLSRRLPVFPMILSLFGVEHRGITHRFIFVLVISIGFYFALKLNSASSYFYLAAYGFIIAYFGHLLGDMLTKGGIRDFFYPFSSKKGVLLPRKFRFYTNSAIESGVFALMIILLVLETSYFGGFHGRFF